MMVECGYRNVFFALLIFVVHLNCVVEHQLLPADAALTEVVAGDAKMPAPLPFHPPAPDHECHGSGCICHGATLATGWLAPTLDANPLGSVAAALAFDPGWALSARLRQVTGRWLSLPTVPLRALTRCAELQVFLI